VAPEQALSLKQNVKLRQANPRQWQWIFIVEGAITVGVGLLGYLLITDFPDKAKFLTEDEREIVQTRIQRDRGDAAVDPMTWSKFVKYCGEPRLWIYGYMFGSSTVGS
jgi:sugar phosphate permease